MPNSGLVVDKEVSLERWRGEERTGAEKVVQAHRDALELTSVDGLTKTEEHGMATPGGER